MKLTDFVDLGRLEASVVDSGNKSSCSSKSFRSIAPSRRTNIGLMFTALISQRQQVTDERWVNNGYQLRPKNE